MKPSCKHQLSLSDGRCGCNRDAPAMPEILNAARAAQVLIAQKPGGHRAPFVKVRLPYDALCSLLILATSSAISRMVFRIPAKNARAYRISGILSWGLPQSLEAPSASGYRWCRLHSTRRVFHVSLSLLTHIFQSLCRSYVVPGTSKGRTQLCCPISAEQRCTFRHMA